MDKILRGFFLCLWPMAYDWGEDASCATGSSTVHYGFAGAGAAGFAAGAGAAAAAGGCTVDRTTRKPIVLLRVIGSAEPR